MIRSVTQTLAALALGTLAGITQAAPITPTFTFFGDLPGATFGGSGIPTDATAVTQVTLANGDEITLGLAATPRFANPELGNDGAGTYTATPGANDGTPGNPGTAATWNFSYYIAGNDSTGSGQTASDYLLEIFYDFDPGAGTDQSALGVLSSVLSIPITAAPIEGSQNLTFGFLGAAAPGVTPPAFPAFDPFALGEYSFAVSLSTATAGPVATAAINVNVVAEQVPAPATVALFALGLLGLAYRRRG